MKRKHNRFCERRAATLIEVVTGLVVLGTVLASVAIARGRFLRQWADAERKLSVAREVDGMMARWMEAPPGALIVPARGTMQTTRGCVWETRWIYNPDVEPLGARLVRLDVIDQSAGGGGVGPRPMLSVDFLVHYVPPRVTSRPVAEGRR